MSQLTDREREYPICTWDRTRQTNVLSAVFSIWLIQNKGMMSEAVSRICGVLLTKWIFHASLAPSIQPARTLQNLLYEQDQKALQSSRKSAVRNKASNLLHEPTLISPWGWHWPCSLKWCHGDVRARPGEPRNSFHIKRPFEIGPWAGHTFNSPRRSADQWEEAAAWAA